jgi:hypothetical protein
MTIVIFFSQFERLQSSEKEKSIKLRAEPEQNVALLLVEKPLLSQPKE